MANTKIDILGLNDLPLVMDLYNEIFHPARDLESFRRRFLGRYNVLIMVATLEEKPVGFFIGFELKPTVFFAWLYGVSPSYRRAGIASQLLEAVHAWAHTHNYHSVRMECHNQHRPMLHLAIANGYDILGIRWDQDRLANLVIFEKELNE